MDGVFGNFGQSRQTHMIYSMLHNLTEVLIAVNSSKKRQTNKPKGFDEMFPEMWRFVTDESQRQDQHTSLTAKETWVKLGMTGELPGV